MVEQLLYNLVGTVSLTSRKFKELMEDLIQNGAYTEDEGRRIIQQFNSDLEALSEQVKGKIRSRAEQALHDVQQPVKEHFDKVMADVREQLRSLPLGSTFIK